VRRADLLRAAAAVTLLLGPGGCTPSAPPGGPLPVPAVETLYRQARDLGDAVDVTRARGASATPGGVPLEKLVAARDAARAALASGLDRAAPPASASDQRALEVMRASLGAPDLVEEAVSAEGACRYDPQRVASDGGPAALSRQLYACFGSAAESLRFGGEETDRLSLMGALATEPDPARRERLWRALAPLWEAVNGDNGPASPYRTLVREGAAAQRREGAALGDAVRGIGVDPETMEAWLVQLLERWRAITPDAPLDPWDFSYAAGGAQRALDPAIPHDALRPLNDRFYADLGADPAALDVQYDLEPRAGKDPVAFTTFGRRPWLVGGRLLPGQPWVFASYRGGGLDNLLELLHETGHAVHIAAIRTRPAFSDWPDSDIFTEALADVAALDLYEPAWQVRYLGTCVPLAAGIRAKYAGIVMDVAWALFEVRVHRQPERDPNAVWSEITERYLRIQPQPDLAWWAVRGQLVDAPGYMMNYAAGAILAADLRARIRELAGPGPEPAWYARVSEGLYRFGLERPSARVIEDFLGRPVSPDALLADMDRATLTGSPGGSCPPSSSP
jgi:hypothetical protein